ncbi:hypothetical protein H4219_002903 [Mycoemilia scoparia]|uniref:DUF221-domain-containing protein n=1 Tax=Mycoemilia scoparia TaxID=417184 RepID=A0A9W8A230_9FUNG|nr:hypothetical protein H4219_002903 [Mycoemilia scoparia]
MSTPFSTPTPTTAPSQTVSETHSAIVTASSSSGGAADQTSSIDNGNHLGLSLLFDPGNVAGTGPYFDSNKIDAITQILTAFFLGSACIIVFSWLRPKFPDLYSPRIRLDRTKPLKLPKSYFGWIWTVVKTSDEFILQTLGLDSLIYMRFWRLCIYIFLLMGAFSLVMIVPVNHKWHELGDSNDDGSIFDSPLRDVPRNTPYGIVHVFGVYIFSIITIYSLDRFTLHVISLRWHFLLYTRHSIPARTLMLTRLPHPLRNSRVLKRFLARMNVGPIERIYVCPSGNKILKYLKNRTKYLKKLEREFSHRLRNIVKKPDYNPSDIYSLALDPSENSRKRLNEMLHEWKHPTKESPPPESEGSTAPLDPSSRTPFRPFTPKRWSDTKELKAMEDGCSANATERGTADCPTSQMVTTDPESVVTATTETAVDDGRAYLSNAAEQKQEQSKLRTLSWLARKKRARIQNKLVKLQKLFMEADINVTRYRLNPEKRGMSHVAFVTLKRSVDAHIVASIQLHSQPNMMVVRLAEEPRAIVWQNIWRSTSVKWIRGFAEVLMTIALMLFWMVPVVFLSTLISLKFLGHYFPNLLEFTNHNRFIRSLLSYTLPSLILTIFLTILPKIQRGFVIFAGARTLVDVDRHVLHRNFIFLVVNIILIFSMSGTIFSSVANLFESPGEVGERLVSALPNVATWFTVYTMLYGAGYQVLKLLQLKGVCRWIWFRWLARSPRDFSELMRPIYLDWGALYPWPMLFFWICITYSCLSPIILLMGIIYFMVGLFIQKYLILYSWYNRYESAGLHWRTVLVWLVIGVIFFQLVMLGFFAVSTSKYYTAPLIFPVLFTLIYLIYRVPKLRNLMYTVPVQLTREVEYHRRKIVKDVCSSIPSAGSGYASRISRYNTLASLANSFVYTTGPGAETAQDTYGRSSAISNNLNKAQHSHGRSMSYAQTYPIKNVAISKSTTMSVGTAAHSGQPHTNSFNSPTRPAIYRPVTAKRTVSVANSSFGAASIKSRPRRQYRHRRSRSRLSKPPSTPIIPKRPPASKQVTELQKEIEESAERDFNKDKEPKTPSSHKDTPIGVEISKSRELNHKTDKNLFRAIAGILSKVLFYLHGDPAAGLLPYMELYAFPQEPVPSEWYDQAYDEEAEANQARHAIKGEKRPTMWQQFGPFVKLPIKWARSPIVYSKKLASALSWSNLSPFIKRTLKELIAIYEVPSFAFSMKRCNTADGEDMACCIDKDLDEAPQRNECISVSSPFPKSNSVGKSPSNRYTATRPNNTSVISPIPSNTKQSGVIFSEKETYIPRTPTPQSESISDSNNGPYLSLVHQRHSSGSKTPLETQSTYGLRKRKTAKSAIVQTNSRDSQLITGEDEEGFTDTSESDDEYGLAGAQLKEPQNSNRYYNAHALYQRQKQLQREIMSDLPMDANTRTFQARSDELPSGFQMGTTRTNFGQRPMTFMKGILDTTGLQYISPALIGTLPRLWLPPNQYKEPKSRLSKEEIASRISDTLSTSHRATKSAIKRLSISSDRKKSQKSSDSYSKIVLEDQTPSATPGPTSSLLSRTDKK